MVACPQWLALSVLGGHTSNAASPGGLPFDCAAYHVGLADFHACHGLRDGKEAVEQLEAIYPGDSEAFELEER